MKISMKKAFLFAIIAAMAATTRVSTQQYSATQVANYTFDDVNMFFRALLLPAVAYTPSTRQYSLDMIFNYVYDAPTHSLRISASGSAVAPDSAHEWAHAWIDTALAKHYASKCGLALDFWMRGIRGDTLAKYTDRHGKVVAWIDTTGSSTWNILKPKFIRPQAAATVNDTIYADDDSTDVPLIYLVNRGIGTESVCILLSSKIEALDASSTTRSAVIGRSDANGYAGIQGQNTSNGQGIGGQANGSGPGGDFTSAGGPGSRSRGVVGAEFIGTGETLFVARKAAGGVAKIWADSSGQLHARGVDFFPQVAAPADSHKLWASQESLWYNDKTGVPHPIWPSGGSPGGGSAFGDTNAYFVAHTFGTGYDSIAGHYFNAIQGAIDAASAAGASSTNRKTVYVFEGTYMEPCTLKSHVNLKGQGSLLTILRFPGIPFGIDSANYSVHNAANFTVEGISIFPNNNGGLNNTGSICSLATPNCSTVVYKDVRIYEEKSTNNCMLSINCTPGYVGYQDTVSLIDCTFGQDIPDETSHPWDVKSACLHVGPMDPSLLLMDHVTIVQTANNLGFCAFEDSTAYHVYIHSVLMKNCLIEVDQQYGGYKACRLEPGFNLDRFEAVHSSFLNVYAPQDTSFVMDATNNYGTAFLRDCTFRGMVGTVNGHSLISSTGCSVYSPYGYYPFFNASDIAGTFDWNTNEASFSYTYPSFLYGAVQFDTNKTLTAYPHEGAMQYKSNASPHDTVYTYMDGAWRNLDRTWAVGRDSVLANYNSDTLTVVGLELGMFIDVQYESDPGVNVGYPFHTVTAGQDILTWPVACVNKFYYRWRIH